MFSCTIRHHAPFYGRWLSLTVLWQNSAPLSCPPSRCPQNPTDFHTYIHKAVKHCLGSFLYFPKLLIKFVHVLAPGASISFIVPSFPVRKCCEKPQSIHSWLLRFNSRIRLAMKSWSKRKLVSREFHMAKTSHSFRLFSRSFPVSGSVLNPAYIRLPSATAPNLLNFHFGYRQTGKLVILLS